MILSFPRVWNVVALVLASMLVLSGCTSSGSSSSNVQAKPTVSAALKQRPSDIDIPVTGKITRTGEIYLLRGLANVFSRGMDAMGARLVRSGLDARVYNHAAWRDLSQNIVARAKKKNVSYPIVIMGHSLGANAAVNMARYLGERGIKVRFVVAFDPTVSTSVGKNVSQVINYYLPKDSATNKVLRGAGFTGSLKNVNVTGMNGVTHMNVEKNTSLQNKSIKRTIALTKKRRRSKKS